MILFHPYTFISGFISGDSIAINLSLDIFCMLLIRVKR